MKLAERDGKYNSGIQSSCQIDFSFESNKENDSSVNLENKLDISRFRIICKLHICYFCIFYKNINNVNKL